MTKFDPAEFKKRFSVLFKIRVPNDLGTPFDGLSADEVISDEYLEYIYKIAGTVISSKSNCKVLPDFQRKEAIYLYIAIRVLQLINNFLLGKSNTHITSAKEGDVSVNFQETPFVNLREKELSDPNIQPFGMMLLDILKMVQPLINTDVKNSNYLIYYPGV